MKKYLLDTHICIYFLNGQFRLEEKIDKVGFSNCFISEVTIAELKFGIEKSTYKERNKAALDTFLGKIEIIHIFPVLDIYAKEKARLKTKGKMLDDFDLLIGATAITHDFILVTRNVSNFDRLHGIVIEDWTSQK